MFGKKDSGKALNGFFSKRQRKTIGIALIFLALAFSTPPILPSIDDFILNIPVAIKLAAVGLPYSIALVATYTLIPFALFVLGVFFFPDSDSKAVKWAKKIIKGFLKGYAKKVKSSFLWLVLSILFAFFVYNYYIGMLMNEGLLN